MHLKKIRVLQFGSSNGLFGAERWILALVRYSDNSQVEHIIFTIKDAPDSPIDLVERAREMGFATDLIHASGPYDPGTIFRTASLIRKHKIDIIHTHGYKSDIVGYLAARLTGIPIISTPHGFELSINTKLNIYQKLGEIFLKRIDSVVPVSEGLRKQCLDKGISDKKIKVIKNGVDIREVEEIAPDQKIISEKRENNIKIIGYVGQLIERKGLPNLIKAMKVVTNSVNARLLLIGEGVMRQALEKIVKEEDLVNHVDFLGFRQDRLAIMKCFDVFVLPSYLEGLPRVVMEAMAARVPVIASDIPGVREIVRHDDTGMLVPADSPDQLADIILGLVKNPEKADRLRQNAYNHVRLNHSAERMAKEYHKLYEMYLLSNE